MHFVYITSINTVETEENDRYVRGEISKCIYPSILIEFSSKVVRTGPFNKPSSLFPALVCRCWQAFNCTNDGAATLKKTETIICVALLTHWAKQNGRHFAGAFKCNSLNAIAVYPFNFHCRLLLIVQLIINQHWSSKWLRAKQATSHYLNQSWLIFVTYLCLGIGELISFSVWEIYNNSSSLKYRKFVHNLNALTLYVLNFSEGT